MSFLDTETFTTVVANTPLIAIDLIVKNDAGEVLLGKRLNAPAKDSWFTPGGRIYKDETLDDAFARITAAELGRSLSINDAVFCGVYEHFYTDSVLSNTISTHYVVLAYTLSTLPSLSTNDQHSGFQWFPLQFLLTDKTVHTNVKRYFTNDSK